MPRPVGGDRSHGATFFTLTLYSLPYCVTLRVTRAGNHTTSIRPDIVPRRVHAVVYARHGRELMG